MSSSIPAVAAAPSRFIGSNRAVFSSVSFMLIVIIVTSIYLPTIWTPFDFIDDGNLVYPAGPMSFFERISLVWAKILANFHDLGPFRPVLWVHWEIQAELLHASPFAWRCVHFIWTGFATGTLLWFMCELGIRPLAAGLATALAMWNPYRGEVWTSLTLAEGIAMPYAILALICAVRGNRNKPSWAWDMGSILFMLLALGCKNTYAALVPAQVFLRMVPDGRNFLQAWRQQGWRAMLLAVTLVMPIAHFIIFKLNRQPGNYNPGLFSWEQLREMLRLLKGTFNLDFIGAGLLFTIITISLASYWRNMWQSYRGVCLTSLLILVCGITIYLPMHGAAGRYIMPAIWGADLIMAVLLSTLFALPTSWEKRLTYGVLALGIIALIAANIDRQQKFAARADMLWQALKYIERYAPMGTGVQWVSGPELNIEEGIHFQWHLQARDHKAIYVQLLDNSGHVMQRRELKEMVSSPTLRLTGKTPKIEQTDQVLAKFATSYHLGKKQFAAYLMRL